MSKTTSALSKATGFFFGLGFAIAQLRYFPLPILTSYLSLASLLSCMIGYGLWFIESHFHPEHSKKLDEWYSFAQYKEQHLLASVLGLIATTLSITALFVPILIIPAIWVLFSSNLIWSIGEYHKLNNPLSSEKSPVKNQRSYFLYTATMAGVALISAISTTISFLFPPAALITMFVAGSLCIGISAVGVGHWLDYYFNKDKKIPKTLEDQSYEQMTHFLGPSKTPDNEASPAPYHGKGLYTPEIELINLKEPESNPEQTCVMSQ